MEIFPKHICMVVMPCSVVSTRVEAQGIFSYAAAFMKFGAVELFKPWIF